MAKSKNIYLFVIGIISYIITPIFGESLRRANEMIGVPANWIFMILGSILISYYVVNKFNRLNNWIKLTIIFFLAVILTVIDIYITFIIYGI